MLHTIYWATHSMQFESQVQWEGAIKKHVCVVHRAWHRRFQVAASAG